MRIENYDHILNILTALSILVAGRDVIFNKNIIWFKKISISGYILVGLTFGLYFFGNKKILKEEQARNISNSNYENDRKTDKAEIINGFNAALYKYKLKYNDDNKSITVIKNNPESVVHPILDLILDSTRIVGDLKKKVNFRIVFKSLDEKIIYRPQLIFISVQKVDGKFKFSGKIAKTFNTELKAYQNSTLWFEAALDIPKIYNVIDTTFYFVKVKYFNKAEGGVEEHPLKHMFFIKFEASPIKIEDIKIRDVIDQNQFREFEEYLIKNKFW